MLHLLTRIMTIAKQISEYTVNLIVTKDTKVDLNPNNNLDMKSKVKESLNQEWLNTSGQSPLENSVQIWSDRGPKLIGLLKVGPAKPKPG